MKTYIVSQTFDTLGDPCRTKHTTLRTALEAASALRENLAQLVAGQNTPDCQPCQPTGYIHECMAWEGAAETPMTAPQPTA
jgi:hypothetical protein